MSNAKKKTLPNINEAINIGRLPGDGNLYIQPMPEQNRALKKEKVFNIKEAVKGKIYKKKPVWEILNKPLCLIKQKGDIIRPADFNEEKNCKGGPAVQQKDQGQ